MKKALLPVVAGAALVIAVALAPAMRTAHAQGQKPPAKPPAPMKLKVGDEAPDFTLLYSDGTKLQKVSLHDYRGKKNVALAFYVLAFTGG